MIFKGLTVAIDAKEDVLRTIESDIAFYKQEYEKGKQEYEKGKQEYEKGKQEYEKGKQEDEMGKREYEMGKQKYEMGDPEDETDAIMNTLASANDEMNANIISLCSGDTHKNTKISFITSEALATNHPTAYNTFKTSVFGAIVNSENVNSENVNSENVNSENVNSENVNSENVNSENVNSKNVKTWMKIYRCNTAFRSILESEFTFEVYYQNKARGLNTDCSFNSPNIIDYGHFDNDDYYYCYIHMDFINELPLNANYTACASLGKLINEVDSCMKSRGVFHNDLLPRNAFKSESSNKPIIIDFGLALSSKRGDAGEWSCPKSESVPAESESVHAESESVPAVYSGASRKNAKHVSRKTNKRSKKMHKQKKTKRSKKTRKQKKTKRNRKTRKH